MGLFIQPCLVCAEAHRTPDYLILLRWFGSFTDADYGVLPSAYALPGIEVLPVFYFLVNRKDEVIKKDSGFRVDHPYLPGCDTCKSTGQGYGNCINFHLAGNYSIENYNMLDTGKI